MVTIHVNGQDKTGQISDGIWDRWNPGQIYFPGFYDGSEENRDRFIFYLTRFE